MSDELWSREEIASPCVKICVIHPETRLCTGCARSIDEITGWGSMGDAARARITAELPTRSAAPKTRRGGRARRQRVD